MMRILIVDDERLARSRLTRLLQGQEDCEIVGEAKDGLSATDLIETQNPDLVLLDISMPGQSGMALARNLGEMDVAPAVVFCTAHEERALEAFDVSAVDYLVKPVRPERLEAALVKVRQFLASAPRRRQFLRSTGGGKEVLIPLESVICLLAEDKYTTVIHTDGEAVINDTLVQLERAHPNRFCRTHRKALVTRSCIRGLNRDGSGVHRVALEGTDSTPRVSRRQLSTVRRIIREGC